ASAARVSGAMRRSASTLPGAVAWGQNESGKLREAMRGASTARWSSMPKTVTFRNTWSIACCCTSPPGVPKGMKSRPSRNAIGGEPVGVAGRGQVGPGALADERAPPRRVGLREEPVGRDPHEVRVAEVGIAVGERELDRLDETVEVRRGVVAEGFQVEALEQVQHLQLRRALAPEPARRDLVAAERRP